jgi:cytochrome c oxidase subunit 2
MGRTAAALAVLACLGLAGAPLAVAGPGGISPPSPATPSGEAINELYWFVFAMCAFVFVAVEAALILFIVRYRRREATPADAEGPQIHGNTRLEIIWTIAPALALVAIAAVVFARTPAVQADPGAEGSELNVRVEAHQFYWQYEYENGVLSLDRLVVPVDRPVALALVTYDVDHSWWVPRLTGKRDAIAGQKNVLRFRAEEEGTYDGQCAEHCGVQHAVMATQVEVVSQREFDRWLSEREAAQREPDTELGRETWEAACAKCHGLEGEGDIGPEIAGNTTLRSRQALIRLLSTGQNTPEFADYMPPVGLGWKGSQYDALIAYVKSNAKLSGEQGGEAQSGG